MAMRWHDLGDYVTPRLEAFGDSWNALSLFCDVIQELANLDSERITEQEFVNILLKCGFEDLTAYESPYKKSGS